MYGLDKRYRSAVAYVQGCNAATEGQLLAGISEWLDAKMYDREGRGAIAWSGLLVYRRFPERQKSREGLLPSGSGWLRARRTPRTAALSISSG